MPFFAWEEYTFSRNVQNDLAIVSLLFPKLFVKQPYVQSRINF